MAKSSEGVTWENQAKRDKFFREGHFKSVEDMDKFIEIAEQVRVSMQETLRIISRKRPEECMDSEL